MLNLGTLWSLLVTNIEELFSRDILNQSLHPAQGQVKWCFVPLGFFYYLFQETVSKSAKYSFGSQPGGAIEIPVFLEFSALAVWQVLQMEFSHSRYCQHFICFSPVFFPCRHQIICDN